LLEEISEWSRQQGWTIDTNPFPESSSSRPDLLITTPNGSVTLWAYEDLVGWGTGRVDLMEYPTLRRVMLLYDEGQEWRVRTDSGIYWPQPWSRETYYDLVERLVRG
jgi:hypothetical protein